MANTFKFGNGNWAVKDGYALAYNDENNNFKPLPFDFTRASSATRVNKQGLIETVPSGKPRIDFTDNTSGHLLLEPSRTNSFLQSNSFNTSPWTVSNATLTGGQTGVGGSTDAWLFTASSGTNEKIVYQVPSLSGNTAVSVFAKKGSNNFLWLRGVVSGGVSKRTWFNLNTGQVGTDQATSSSMVDMGNGWYRCTAVFNQQSGFEFYIGNSNADGQNSVSTTGTIYIQYAQAEVGSYATSYIPTEGSSVTRVAETSEINSVPNVPTSYPFVMYVEGNHTLGQESGTCGFYDKSNQYYYYSILFASNNKIQALSRPQGTENILTSTSIYTDGFHKVAVLFLNDTTIKLYVDGELDSTKTDCSNNSFNTAFTDYVIGVFRSNSTNSCNIKDFRIFNHELTDTELKNLTS